MTKAPPMTSPATPDEMLEGLIQDAISVLHHDTTDGSDVDKYERESLRKKFSARLAAKPADEGMRTALRKLALKRHVRETHAGPVWNGGSCALCRAEWNEPFEGNEHHRDNCLAALSTGQPTR